MKKTLLLLLCFAITLSSVAAQNSIDSFKTINGDFIKRGDVIWVGSAKSSLGGRNINEKKDVHGMEMFNDAPDSLAFTDVVVTGFAMPSEKRFLGKKDTLTVVYSAKLNKKYYINIDRAIAEGEIASRYKDHSNDKAVFLSDDLLLACCIRENGLTIDDKTILFFIKLKDYDLYRKCIADEFEFHAARDKYKQMLENMVTQFDFSATYYIKHSLDLDKYNFERQAYPLSVISDKERDFHKYGDYEFMVTNPEFGKFLPLAPDEAQKCNLRRRNASMGHISSYVYGRIYFKIWDKIMEIKLTSSEATLINRGLKISKYRKYKNNVIGIQLTKIEVYDYPHCDYNFIGSVE